MKIKIAKHFVIMFAIGLFSVFALSCDDGGGGDRDLDVESLTITGESGDQVALDGNWGSVCIDTGDGASKKVDISYSGDDLTLKEDEWFDSITCVGESDAIIIVRGNIVLGDEVAVNKDGQLVNATEADIFLTSVQYTITDPADIADFNAGMECGFDDWVAGIPKELLGTVCYEDVFVMDIFYVDDTGIPVLYLGVEDGPLDVNGYPTEIEPNIAYELF